MRLIKMLGSVLVGALVLLVLAATVASAAEFKATSSPVALFAGQDTQHVLTLEGNAIQCEMNGCDYELLQPNESFVGNVALRCPKEARVRLFASFLGSQCEVFFGETGNTNLSSVSYKNEATSPTTVKVTVNITGIVGEKTIDTGICPLKGPGAVKAAYTGTSTVEGRSGIGVSVG